MSDAIIVLGRGINPDGSLPADPISRVDTAVELFRGGVAPVIIMSGGQSYHVASQAPLSEARAMATLAIAQGVPAHCVLEESHSVNTVANALNVKAAHRQWKSFTVVASDEHMPRVTYLFDKVFGPSYQLAYVASTRVLGDEEYASEVEHEARSFSGNRAWFDGVRPGDDRAITRILQQRHPAFAASGGGLPGPG